MTKAEKPQQKTATKWKRKERIYEAKPLFDHALTACFIALCMYTLWIVKGDKEASLMFFVALVSCGVLINLVRFASSIIGRWLDFNNNLEKTTNMKKFTDQAWQWVIHVFMTVFELCILEPEWYPETKNAWIPNPQVQISKPSLKIFYLSQLAVWIYTCFSHRFLEARHKDYFMMFAHHVVTIALVAFSHSQNYHRMGLLVLMVHDLSDVPVDTLKLVNYLGWEGPRYFFATEIAFVTMLVSWVALRLVVFPMQVIRCSMFESVEQVGSADKIPFYYASNVLLCALLVLHVWWFYLMLRIAYKLVAGQSGHDVGRDEYEGTSDSDGGLKND